MPAHLRIVPPPEPLDLPERDRPLRQDVTVTAIVVVICAVAMWLMASRPARASEPLPDLRRTMAQLDRIHDALIPAQTQRCVIHAGGRCL